MRGGRLKTKTGSSANDRACRQRNGFSQTAVWAPTIEMIANSPFSKQEPPRPGRSLMHKFYFITAEGP
jgi:hypothetical protein